MNNYQTICHKWNYAQFWTSFSCYIHFVEKWYIEDVCLACPRSFTVKNHVSRSKKKLCIHICGIWSFFMLVCLFVFYIPSTGRSFRDGTPIYCPLQRTWVSVNTPFLPGIEPRAVVWQSITLPLRHASSTMELLIWLYRFSIRTILPLHS